MNWNEYLNLSEKTLSEEFHCGGKIERLLHSLIGILTECDELLENYDGSKKFDPINIKEELGDLLWYMAILGRDLKIDMPVKTFTKRNTNPREVIIDIARQSLKGLDILKKKLYYNKQVEENILTSISNSLFILIMEYAFFYDINIESSFDRNIEKLKARYGDKFESERAINRNLTEERKILEK